MALEAASSPIPPALCAAARSASTAVARSLTAMLVPSCPLGGIGAAEVLMP